MTTIERIAEGVATIKWGKPKPASLILRDEKGRIRGTAKGWRPGRRRERARPPRYFQCENPECRQIVRAKHSRTDKRSCSISCGRAAYEARRRKAA